MIVGRIANPHRLCWRDKYDLSSLECLVHCITLLKVVLPNGDLIAEGCEILTAALREIVSHNDVRTRCY